MAQERTAVREVAAERRSAAATVQRSAAAPAPTSAARALQQRLGNQGTQALVARSVAAPTVQRLAKVSSPSDPAELEAHDTARKVMRMAAPAPAVAPPGAGPTPSIQRAAAPPPAPATAAPVHVPMAGGAPLPESVRGFMEPRFGADFGDVRVHTGESAARRGAELNAHAFTVGKHVFFGRDKFQPDSAAGKELIAHELTHTIQQGAAVQRSADTTVSQRAPPQVQRLSFGIGALLDYAADKANYIPGFRLLTIVLGMNPVNLAPVERNAANLLRALLELIPVTGPLLVQALEAHGVIARAGAWVDTQVRTLGLVGSALKRALDAFLASLSAWDIANPVGVWERAKRIFTEPIGRLLEFGKSLAVEILHFIREAVLLPLARLAEGTRGYDLLKAVLGEDPITGQPVARSPDNLIGGFMKLIGKEEIWENIKKANAVPRAWAWFQGAMTAMMGYVRQIPALFLNALKALEVIDFIVLPKAFVKLAGVFGGFVVEFFTWAGHAAYALLEIVFEVLAPKAIPYLKKVAGAFRKILDNPIEFVGHLIDAAKLGFQQFAANFGQHLKTSIIEWLTGSLPGVYIPQKLELGEIVKFVFSVLGLTWQNIRQKLVKVVGETAVKAMETGFDIVVTLVTQGPAAAWEKIKDQLANLKDMVIGGIVDFITETIVKKAVAKVLSLLVPGGAFIQAILSIYDTVMVFIDKLQKIIQVATAFLDSMMDIASGKIEGAAKKVETTLAGLLTLAISFLAGFLGLGKIADKVMDLINTKVRAPIDKAIDFLIDWIVKAAKSLFASAKAGVKKALGWASSKSEFSDEEGHKHEIYVDAKAGTPHLVIASTPQTAGAFLDFYVKNRGEPFATDKKKEIDLAKKAVAAADKQVEKINKVEAADKTDEQLVPLQQELLALNIAVGEALSALIGTDLGKLREKYMLEGLSGTFGSIPKPKYDDFTPDHQPQAAVLEGCAELPYFTASGPMFKRAAGRANAGYAINLHVKRHKAGRTFFGKGSATKAAFFGRVPKQAAATEPERQKQRQAVVNEIKKELAADVAAMKDVVKVKDNFADIAALKLPKKDEETMIEEIGERIVAGEGQMAGQDLDSLAN
jgi:hypothetical protein